MKRNGINQAVSTGLAKKSYDEEIIYHLKKKTSDIPFNMIEARFEKSVVIGEEEFCSNFKYVIYLIMGYPYYVL
jgi:hypothetical protein